jgi:hypothetical protein
LLQQGVLAVLVGISVCPALLYPVILFLISGWMSPLFAKGTGDGSVTPLHPRLASRGALIVLALASTFGLGSCTHSSNFSAGQPQEGHVFSDVVESWGIATTPPGDEWGFQVASLRNTTSRPLTLRSATVLGPGVGKVVQVVSIEVTPYPNVSGFRNVTRPPVFYDYGKCLVGRLSPVEGYVLQPNARPISLFVIMRSNTPGAFKIAGHKVLYQQAGVMYQQVQHTGVSGHVAIGAEPLKPYPEETPCLDQSGVELLPTSAPPLASGSP